MPEPIDPLTADERADFDRLQDEITFGNPGTSIGLFRVYLDGKPRAAVCSVRAEGSQFLLAPIALLLTKRETVEFPPDRPFN